MEATLEVSFLHIQCITFSVKICLSHLLMGGEAKLAMPSLIVLFWGCSDSICIFVVGCLLLALIC